MRPRSKSELIPGIPAPTPIYAQLAHYDDYEASVVGELNRHVSALLAALGLDQGATAVTGSALSRVCGRTLSDWGAPIG